MTGTDNIQSSLFDPPVPERKFDGETYDAARDHDRLTGQLLAVFEAMKDGKWRSLSDIKARIGKGSEAAISARLRDLRKGRFGCHTVERVNEGAGLWLYQLVPKTEQK
jgi:hypothetical protein